VLAYMMLNVVMSEYLQSLQKFNTVSWKSHHRFPGDRWYVCSESLFQVMSIGLSDNCLLLLSQLG